MADTLVMPDNSGNNGIPFSIPVNGFGNNGFGSFNSIADLFGLAIIASMFGWGNVGFGGGGFGGGNAAGFLSNQLNNDSGRELIMNAVTAQGEASRSAIQNLATTLGQDFNLVNGAVQNVRDALSAIAANQGMNTLQVVNAIQNGNASLASQLCQCCYQAQIRTLEQTNQLGTQADRNTASVVGAINTLQTNITKEFCDIKEREMQEKINTQGDIITQLRGQIDNANQTAQISAYVNSLIAPLQQAVAGIASKMPNTVPVQWPNITAVNTTPQWNGYGYGINNIAF